MTVFQTPESISVLVQFGVGDLRVIVSDRMDTVVEVKPSDPFKEGDVNAAKQIRVEYVSGSLLVKGPKNWRQWAPRGGRESVDVEIQLPRDSRVNTDLGMATVRTNGGFGDLDLKTSLGDIQVDMSRSVKIRTGFGDVSLGKIAGDADVKTGSGRIDIGSIEGSAIVKSANGGIHVDEIEGRAQLQTSNGTIEVDRGRSDVRAKTALGDVQLGALSKGAVEVKTAYGQIELGVLSGVTTWLDVSTGFGRVNNELEEVNRPSAGEETVEIRAHTAAGDITISRVDTQAEVTATS